MPTEKAVQGAEREGPAPAEPFASPLRLFIASLGGVGQAPVAPGTFGTLASVPFVLLLAEPGSAWIYAVGTLTATILSIWACGACEARYGVKDPGQAVADELCGFLVTMAFIPLSVGTVTAGFFLFRLTDIIKPFPARALERLPRGWGIVADDLASGLWANLLLRAALAVLRHLRS